MNYRSLITPVEHKCCVNTQRIVYVIMTEKVHTSFEASVCWYVVCMCAHAEASYQYQASPSIALHLFLEAVSH